MKEWMKVGMIGMAIFILFYFSGLGTFLSWFFKIGSLDNTNPWIISVFMAILFVGTHSIYSFFKRREFNKLPVNENGEVEVPEEATTPAQKIAEIILWIMGAIALGVMVWTFRSFAG